MNVLTNISEQIAFNMPDESCRTCGGMLLEYAFCGKCRSVIQYICRICGNKTLEQFHESVCFVMETHNEKTFKHAGLFTYNIQNKKGRPQNQN